MDHLHRLSPALISTRLPGWSAWGAERSTTFLRVLGPCGWQHSALLDTPGSASPCGLTVPARLRSLLANHLLILSHFHPLLWLAEPPCFSWKCSSHARKGA